MQDNILTLSEITHSISKSNVKAPFFILKLDLERAFDNLNWEILESIMQLICFPQKYIAWVRACLKSATFHCKINGSKSQSFRSFKGLRQGDPISPYLFILFQQIFTLLLQWYVDRNLVIPYKLGNLSISHLMFADDVVIITKSTPKSVRHLQEFLQLYSRCSGQIINTSKSAAYFPDKCSRTIINSICRKLRISEGQLPFKYLGSYIHSKRIPIALQNEVVDKALNRFNGWANQHISQAGKLIQLNAVVNSIPIHSLSTTGLDKKVVNRISSLSRSYFWQNNQRGRSFHLINWKTICTSKFTGGLGVRDIATLKDSIGAPRLLPLLNHDNKLWSKLLHAKYGPLHPWAASPKQASPTFKVILNSLHNLRDGFQKVIYDGGSTNIWEDSWISPIPLQWWPTFFNNQLMHSFTTVSELITNGAWNVFYLHSLFNRSITEKILTFHLPKGVGKDTWVWSNSRDGHISAKIAYNFMHADYSSSPIPLASWKLLWDLPLIPRIKTFLWKLLWRRLPTADHLANFSNIPRAPCCLCSSGVDTDYHIFIECPTACNYWLYAEEKIGFLFQHKQNWLAGAWLQEGNTLPKNMRYNILIFIAASLWFLWKNRNDKLFRSEQSSISRMFCHSVAITLESHETRTQPRTATVSLHNPSTVLSNSQTAPPVDPISASNIAQAFCDAAWTSTVLPAGLGFYIQRRLHRTTGQLQRFTASPLSAELTSIRYCMGQANTLSINSITLHSDSQVAVKILNKELRTPWPERTLVDDIWNLASKFTFIIWKFLPRHLNSCAHNLAQGARHLNEDHMHSIPPLPTASATITSAEATASSQTPSLLLSNILAAAAPSNQASLTLSHDQSNSDSSVNF